MGDHVNEHVKRPLNPFMLYAKVERPQISKENQNMSNSEVSKVLGMNWKILPAYKKDKYRCLAAEEKKQHKLQHPDYVYSPKPRIRRGRSRSANDLQVSDKRNNFFRPISETYLPRTYLPRTYLPGTCLPETCLPETCLSESDDCVDIYSDFDKTSFVLSDSDFVSDKTSFDKTSIVLSSEEDYPPIEDLYLTWVENTLEPIHSPVLDDISYADYLKYSVLEHSVLEHSVHDD